jgi:hypothetical protein
VTAGAPLVGQVVVSERAGSSAGGYALLASSPRVAPADRDFLERSSGVTDFLHRERTPGPFLSFYRLPSGCWALTRRFVSGMRRGSFNRVVAHTLVTPEDVLEMVDRQPWLLAQRARYRSVPAGGVLQDLPTLGITAADPTVRELPEQELALEGEPGEENLFLILEWRRVLVATWGQETLAKQLCAVFAALQRGQRVMFCQAPGYEELLALSWSLLPPADRMVSPWTTHFAPGVRVLFRMANAVDPRAARDLHPHPDEWTLFGGEAPAGGPPAGAAAKALAEVALADEQRVAAVLGGWRRHGFRLIGDESGDLARWLTWLEEAPRLLASGLGDGAALAAFLRERPWLELENREALAGATLLRRYRHGEDFDSAAAEIAAELDAAGEARTANPEPLARRLGGHLDVEAWERTMATLAVAVVRRTESLGEAALLAVARLLVELEPPDRVDMRPAAAMRRDLLLQLARGGSEEGLALLIRVAADPGELEPLLAQLGSQPQLDSEVALALLDAAWKGRETSGGATLNFAAALVEVGAWAPEVLRHLPADTVTAAFDGMRQRPGLLVAALERWTGSAYDRAAAELERWFQNDDAEAAAVASGLVARGVAANGLRPVRAMGGLSLRALGSSLPSLEALLAFALAGARVLDAAATAEGVKSGEVAEFERLLGRWQISAEEAESCAATVLDGCEIAVRAGGKGSFGWCHRGLLDLLRRGVAGDGRMSLRMEEKILAVEVRWGLVNLASALERLDRLATELHASEDLFVASVERVTTGQLEQFGGGAHPLLELLCGEEVLPTVKWALEDKLLRRALESIDGPTATLLAELPRRPVHGTLLLAAGARLVRPAGGAGSAAAVFVRLALAAGRMDVAIPVLRQGLGARAGRGGVFRDLSLRERRELKDAIRVAMTTPEGWRLSAFGRSLPRWRGWPRGSR